MVTRTRLPSIVALAVAGVALCGSTGCMCKFEAHRAGLTEKKTLKITDPEPVPLPATASSKIPVYWTDRSRREVMGGTMPDRPYDIIGRVRGVVGVAWQSDVYLDTQFRRAAAALGGDAVINARKGTYNPKDPSNEYTGHVIKWKTDSSAPE